MTESPLDQGVMPWSMDLNLDLGDFTRSVQNVLGDPTLSGSPAVSLEGTESAGQEITPEEEAMKAELGGMDGDELFALLGNMLENGSGANLENLDHLEGLHTLFSDGQENEMEQSSMGADELGSGRSTPSLVNSNTGNSSVDSSMSLTTTEQLITPVEAAQSHATSTNSTESTWTLTPVHENNQTEPLTINSESSSYANNVEDPVPQAPTHTYPQPIYPPQPYATFPVYAATLPQGQAAFHYGVPHAQPPVYQAVPIAYYPSHPPPMQSGWIHGALPFDNQYAQPTYYLAQAPQEMYDCRMEAMSDNHPGMLMESVHGGMGSHAMEGVQWT